MQSRFDGDKAIYVEGGLWRVVVSSIDNLDQPVVLPDVEEVPTRGFVPARRGSWDIVGGSLTEF